ncbi:GGDEF domain-containing protein [Actinosynnema sp. NPDC023658]|uniref:GGDEF domain-containing protein n=1 Tax=Actinosynnema sp. NPDC023658 TaxID=3155465 RepID=UPI0033F9ABBC
MVSGSRRRRAIHLQWCRDWSLWRLPRAVLIYVLTVEAVAVVAVASVATLVPVTGRHWTWFAVLSAAAVVHFEAARGLERVREVAAEGSPYAHPQSIWLFAGVLVLPPPLLAGLVAVSYGYGWLRIYRSSPLHRKVFSAATVLLACWSAGAILVAVHPDPALPHAAQLNGPTGLGALVAAGVAYWLVNLALVLGAIVLSSPTRPGRDVLGPPSQQLVIAASIGLGTGLAVVLVTAPWVMPVLVVTMLGMHLGLLLPVYRTAARVDGKTGALTSVAWTERAAAELTRAKAVGMPVAVLVLDLDHFSDINNTHGHLAGDHALRAVAAEVRRQVRDGDLVGRWGGEEFVVLLPGTDLTAAWQVAERIRETVRIPLTDLPTDDLRTASFSSLSSPFSASTPPSSPLSAPSSTSAASASDGTLQITASLGVAGFPAHGDTVDRLLLAADTALYRAKNNGRDRVEMASARGAGS